MPRRMADQRRFLPAGRTKSTPSTRRRCWHRSQRVPWPNSKWRPCSRQGQVCGEGIGARDTGGGICHHTVVSVVHGSMVIGSRHFLFLGGCGIHIWKTMGWPELIVLCQDCFLRHEENVFLWGLEAQGFVFLQCALGSFWLLRCSWNSLCVGGCSALHPMQEIHNATKQQCTCIAHGCVYVHTHTYTYDSVYTYVYMYFNVCVCGYASVIVYVCWYMSVCVFVSVCALKCICVWYMLGCMAVVALVLFLAVVCICLRSCTCMYGVVCVCVLICICLSVNLCACICCLWFGVCVYLSIVLI